MKNKEFLELIEAKEEEILEALENAFCNSIDNRNLKFNVELYSDGDIEVWKDIAGGNMYKSSNRDNTSIRIGSFCNQYLDIENNEEEGETEEAWLEWYKDEYKHEEAEQKLEVFKDDLKESAEYDED